MALGSALLHSGTQPLSPVLAAQLAVCSDAGSEVFAPKAPLAVICLPLFSSSRLLCSSVFFFSGSFAAPTCLCAVFPLE